MRSSVLLGLLVLAAPVALAAMAGDTPQPGPEHGAAAEDLAVTPAFLRSEAPALPLPFHITGRFNHDLLEVRVKAPVGLTATCTGEQSLDPVPVWVTLNDGAVATVCTRSQEPDTGRWVLTTTYAAPLPAGADFDVEVRVEAVDPLLPHAAVLMWNVSLTSAPLAHPSLEDPVGSVTHTQDLSATIDNVPPAIAFTGQDPAPNANGWNNVDVTLAWACADDFAVESAVVTVVVTGEGPDLGGIGTCRDLAGNEASDTRAGVDIDRTPPTATFAATDPLPNAAGWHRTDVVVSWTCADNEGGSGVVDATVEETVTGEGSALEAEGTCADLADNTDTDTRTGIMIDQTLPAIEFVGFAPAPNERGWNDGDVTGTWGCSDALSGPLSEDVTADVPGEGEGLGSTGVCEDIAGNTNSDLQGGVNIDRTPPEILFVGQDPPATAAGWNNGDVTLTWSCDDAISDVVEPTVEATATGEGAAVERTGTCTDLAGNTHDDTQSVKIDRIAPRIEFAGQDPPSNDEGWNKDPVTLTWTCFDDLGEVNSGPVDAEVQATLPDEDADQAATGTCEDLAGNTADDEQLDVDIDLTAPDLAATPDRDANANGWYDTAVTLSFACTDALSGEDAASVPADHPFTAEGEAQSVSVSCSDLAGNVADLDTGPVSIDLTSPGIALASRLPAANDDGWNNGPVTVTWTCSDGLSGSADATVSETVSTEGEAQSASGTCFDLAGNDNGATEEGINIDLAGPSIAFVGRDAEPNANGWYSSPVTLTWSCIDTGSGVVAATVTETLATDATDAGITGTCVDLAGNSAGDTQSGYNLDQVAPTITFAGATPPANADGWNTGDVELAWSCSDDRSGAASPTVTKTVTGEGSDLGATGTCADLAGNTADDPQGGLKIDRTPPTITLASRTPAANENGWNSGDVTVTWTCADTEGGSGPASPSVQDVVDTEGADLAASGTCADVAGNTAGDAVSGIQIDRTRPSLNYGGQTPSPPPDLGFGWINTDAVQVWTCLDAVSGPVATTIRLSVTGEGAGLGNTATCEDLAGNTASDQRLTVNIDRTPPTVTYGGATPASDGAGWNTGDVTLAWTCDDALSGAIFPSITATIKGAGIDLSATGTCFDQAFNDASDTQGGFDIDRTPPEIELAATTPAPNAAGWNTGDVTLTWACSDDVSGVLSATTSQTVTGEGVFSVTGACLNNAGLVSEDLQTVKIDRAPPAIAFDSQSPLANLEGWNTGDVTLSWTCTDSLSGAVASPVAGLVTGEGVDLEATGTCTDQAGLTSTHTQGGVKIDRTPPSATYGASPPPNANGWNKGAVNLAITCSDALSGNGGGDASAHIASEGTNIVITTTCFDRAHNTFSASTPPLNIDLTPPTITYAGFAPPANAAGWHNGDVTFTWICGDALSGPEEAFVTETITGEGDDLTADGTCTDLAGNTATLGGNAVDIDRTPPTVVFSTADGGVTPFDEITASFTSSGSSVQCAVDDAAPAPCDDPTFHTFPLVAEGPHTLRVDAADDAGNTGSASISVLVDRTAPVVDITFPDPGDRVRPGDIAVRFSVTDATTTTVRCRLEGVGYLVDELCAAPGMTFNDVPRGTYTLTIRAADVLFQETVATVTFTVRSGGGGGGSVLPDDTGGATGGSGDGGTGGTGGTGGSGGSGGGDDTTLPGAGEPIVLAAAPTVEASGAESLPGAVTNDASPVLRFTFSAQGGADEGQSFVTIDGLPVTVDFAAGGEVQVPTSGLADGMHVARVVLVDANGQRTETSWTFTVDTTPPTFLATGPEAVVEGNTVVAALRPFDTLSGVDLGSLAVTVDGRPAVVQVDGDRLRVTFTGALEPGPHVVGLSVLDEAGNLGTRTLTVTIGGEPVSVPGLELPLAALGLAGVALAWPRRGQRRNP